MIWCHLHDPALLAAAQLVLGEGPDLVDGGGGERAQHGLGHLEEVLRLFPERFLF